MEITPIGWVLLLLGPALMLFKPKWLYNLAIFFLPFSATEIANVGSGGEASGVQAPMFLGMLVVLRAGYIFLRKPKFQLPQRSKTQIFWLGVFIASTVVSLVMPIWIHGRVQIPSSELLNDTTTPLYLSSKNITGVIYMLFGFSYACFIALMNMKTEMLVRTMKAFLAGTGFAACWGILELVCKISGIPYPAWIFNNGVSNSALGYLETFGGVLRLSSVTVEPSMFARTLLLALPLCVPFVFGKSKLFGKIPDLLLLLLLFVVLCLTTSSNAYLGIAIMFVLTIGLCMARRVLSVRLLIPPAVIVGIAAILYETVPMVSQVLDMALFNKSTDYSALERLKTISDSYDMFLHYPVLGIGWASITSHDLVVNILANAGCVGLLTYMIAIYTIFGGLYRSIREIDLRAGAKALIRLDTAIYISLGVTFACSVISGSLNTFTFYWFLLGLAIAVPCTLQGGCFPREYCPVSFAVRRETGKE
jgi:hypothetical protein